jgi:hypothetical protein
VALLALAVGFYFEDLGREGVALILFMVSAAVLSSAMFVALF